MTVDPLAHWIIGTGLVWSTGISTQLATQTTRSAQSVIANVGRGFGIPGVEIRDTVFRGNYASLTLISQANISQGLVTWE